MTRSPTEVPFVELADRAQWRAWLAAHHADSSGVSVALGKKGGSATSLSYDDAVEEALCFGWIDSKATSLDDQRYIQYFSPRRPGGTWSRSNKERVKRLIAQGLMTPAGLAAIEAAKANGAWTALDDVDSLMVPDDLARALAADSVAEAGFAGISDSNRKVLLHWIRSAKRPETRAKRIAEAVQSAASGRLPF